MKKSYSDSYMLNLWRKAVKTYDGDQCIFDGQTPVECHHIVKRRHFVTRYDHKNGIPLCSNCHYLADTILMKKMILNYIGEKRYNYLIDREMISKKEFLLEHALTEFEFKKSQVEELKKIIDEKITVMEDLF